jgi:Peptidase family C25
MMQNPSNKTEPQLIERQKFLQLLKMGLESQSFQFIRQAAMSWLASYPGDLEINLLLVQALIKEGRDSMALPILEKILRNDCEYLDALRVAETLYAKSDTTKSQQVGGIIQALGNAPANGQNLPVWGVKLFMASQSMQVGNLQIAQSTLMEVLTQKEAPSLAGIIHLQLAEKENDLNLSLNLGRVYHSRWPDCVQISLLLAKTWIDGGSQDEAVNLMHECAALDPAGQVPRRMWGENFDFKPLYPEKMQIVVNFAIPGTISGKFGLNNLDSGHVAAPANAPQVQRSEVHSFDGYRVLPTEEQVYPDHPRVKEAAAKVKDPVVEEVQKEFEKIADQLKTPSSARTDKRFPAYVILTTRTGLTQQYGQQSAQVILDELTKLNASIQKSHNWHALTFLPDDLTICGKYGITPVDGVDPWKIKLALTDLDAALAKTGEMIGCVLIVGGEKVVPFHNLPNPTDDSDATVPSDNPYGSLDKNYYVGDWPVGRLPGDASDDSGLLLTQIRNITQYHDDDTGSSGWLNQLLRLILFFSQAYSKNFTNLGYTAAIWQRSSLPAFKPIGDARNLYLSPNGKSAGFSGDKMARAPYCYFNLHGVEDGSDWYGQKDTSDTSNSEDYPVALQPSVVKKNLTSPRIVFSEACYGGHIAGLSETDSIALTFMGQGVLALIASTTIAYGSVTTPLIGGDLLANLVMKYLAEGQAVGNAFLKAKVDFVREMNLRQGYLDGEDQKTLISFILYGDPLVAYDPYQVTSKTIAREKNHPVVKTVVDQSMDEVKSSPISAKAIANAKEMARQYLPGIEYAEVHLSRQHVRTNGNVQLSGANQGKSNSARQSSRVVVSFSKQISFDQHIHRQYARVTLDQQGKVVKLAISR